MNRNKSKSRINRTMPMVYPNAAAISDGSITEVAQYQLQGKAPPFATLGTDGTLTVSGTSTDDDIEVNGHAASLGRECARLRLL